MWKRGLADRISLKTEYLYLKLDEENGHYGESPGQNMDFSTQAHIFRAGLNYHFQSVPLEAELQSGPWDGVYAGLHVGGGAFTGRSIDWDANLYLDPSGDWDVNAFAALAGAQAGVNFQLGNVVFGIEADFSKTNFDESAHVGVTSSDRVWSSNAYIKAEMDWLATFRGRLGMAHGDAMFFVTGGVAVAEVNQCVNDLYEHNYPDLGPEGRGYQNICAETNPDFAGAHARFDDVTWGVIMGGGVEVMLRENVSLKAEYLFAQMDRQNEVFNFERPGSGFGEGEDLDFSSHVHIARVGLNYHF